MSIYGLKVVVCGNIVETYEYKNPVKGGFKTGRVGRGSSAENEEKEINREKVLSRARRDLRRIVNCNVRPTSKFLTLTFKDNIQDIESANYEFKKFIKRLDYNLGFKVQYSAVIEFQERGAIHYHVILYNCSKKLKFKQIESLWGHGFIKLNKITNVDNVGAYICKYMTKCEDEIKLRGKKMYFNSRGLLKPEIIKEPELAIKTLQSLANQTPKFSNVFENDYNTIQYNQYIL